VGLNSNPRRVLNRGNLAFIDFLHLLPVVPALGTTESRPQAVGWLPQLSYDMMVGVG
jgi:hypothetical protein